MNMIDLDSSDLLHAINESTANEISGDIVILFESKNSETQQVEVQNTNNYNQIQRERITDITDEGIVCLELLFQIHDILMIILFFFSFHY